MVFEDFKVTDSVFAEKWTSYGSVEPEEGSVDRVVRSGMTGTTGLLPHFPLKNRQMSVEDAGFGIIPSELKTPVPNND